MAVLTPRRRHQIKDLMSLGAHAGALLLALLLPPLFFLAPEGTWPTSLSDFYSRPPISEAARLQGELFGACARNDPRAVAKALDAGAQADELNSAGKTPLMLASLGGAARAVRRGSRSKDAVPRPPAPRRSLPLLARSLPLLARDRPLLALPPPSRFRLSVRAGDFLPPRPGAHSHTRTPRRTTARRRRRRFSAIFDRWWHLLMASVCCRQRCVCCSSTASTRPSPIMTGMYVPRRLARALSPSPTRSGKHRAVVGVCRSKFKEWFGGSRGRGGLIRRRRRAPY